jgi:hypothetical protein
MSRACLKLTGYNSDTQVDGLKVDGERLLGTSAFGLNTCVVISQSFEKNMGNGGQ